MSLETVKLSVIIPTYNSSKFIEKTLFDVTNHMSSAIYNWEIIIVDDSSSDDTFNVVRNFFYKCDVNFRLIQLLKNRGQNNALFAGVKEAKGQYVVTMDDDMEVPALEISRILMSLERDSATDVLIGIPKVDKRSLFRRIGTTVHNKINYVLFRVNFQASGFRIIRRNVVDAIISCPTVTPHIGFLLIETTKRIKNFHISKNPGLRSSNYSSIALIKLVIWNMFNYTSVPLDLISNFGLLTSACSTIFGLYTVIQYFTGFPHPISNPGWTSLITAIFFLSGIILMSLGIIGKFIMKLTKELSVGHSSFKRNEVTKYESFDDIKKSA